MDLRLSITVLSCGAIGQSTQEWLVKWHLQLRWLTWRKDGNLPIAYFHRVLCQPTTAIEINGNVKRFLQISQTSLDVERQDVVVIFLMLCCKVLYLSPSHIYTHTNTHTESDWPCDCTCFTSPPLCTDTNVTWQRGYFLCHWGRCTGPWTTHSDSHSYTGCNIIVSHCLYSWADTGSPNFSSEQRSSREPHTPLSFIHSYKHTHTHTHVGSDRSQVWLTNCRRCFCLCEFECFEIIFLGKQWHSTKMPHIRPWTMFMANSKLKD